MAFLVIGAAMDGDGRMALAGLVASIVYMSHNPFALMTTHLDPTVLHSLGAAGSAGETVNQRTKTSAAVSTTQPPAISSNAGESSEHPIISLMYAPRRYIYLQLDRFAQLAVSDTRRRESHASFEKGVFGNIMRRWQWRVLRRSHQSPRTHRRLPRRAKGSFCMALAVLGSDLCATDFLPNLRACFAFLFLNPATMQFPLV